MHYPFTEIIYNTWIHYSSSEIHSLNPGPALKKQFPQTGHDCIKILTATNLNQNCVESKVGMDLSMGVQDGQLYCANDKNRQSAGYSEQKRHLHSLRVNCVWAT